MAEQRNCSNGESVLKYLFILFYRYIIELENIFSMAKYFIFTFLASTVRWKFSLQYSPEKCLAYAKKEAYIHRGSKDRQDVFLFVLVLPRVLDLGRLSSPVKTAENYKFSLYNSHVQINRLNEKGKQLGMLSAFYFCLARRS